MPDRAGVDDDESLKRLIAVWRDGAADLQARADRVEQAIRRELLSPSFNANTVRRLQLQRDRIEVLEGVASSIADSVADRSQAWIYSGRFADVYAAGGAKSPVPFAWTAPHRAAIQVLADDTFEDVLAATGFVSIDAKRFVRDVGRTMAGWKLTGGKTAQQQGREFARELRDEFGRRGIGSVIYRDGSRHSFGEYGDMLLRTKTGVAYNMGTLNQSRMVGIEFFEILDGSLCGLTSHGDGQLANGLIVDYATAAAYPLSHPNCRRAINPRPELNASNVGDAVSLVAPEERADQTAFEAAMREQSRQAAAGRARRARRERRPRRERRTPRSVPTGQREAVAPAPAARIPAGKHSDRIEYQSSAAQTRLAEGVAVVDRLHTTRPVVGAAAREGMDSPLRMYWATGNSSKGGHYSPLYRTPKPKRPPRSKRTPGWAEEYRARYEEWRSTPMAPTIRVVKRKIDDGDGYLVSLWHEMGHWQDYDTEVGEFVSRLAARGVGLDRAEVAAMREFLEAANGSSAIGELRAAYALRNPDYLAYTSSVHEVWARAYSQWVANRSGRDFGAYIEKVRAWTPGFQWDPAEFASLEPLIENVLRARGVLNEGG